MKEINKEELLIEKFKQQEQEAVENLKLAESEKNIDNQIKYLIALGDIHIEKGNTKLKPYESGQYSRSMALYYSALNRSITSDQKKLVLKKIELAEQSFLKSIGSDSDIISINEIDDYKKTLFDLREWCKEQLKIIDKKYDITEIESEEEKQPIENKRAEHVRKIQEKIQEIIRDLISSMITAAIKQLGDPPCKYTIIGFGSFAECRMTPYSDLEFGILLEEEKEEYKEYFRNLTELTHLKVIHLGETVLRPMKITSLTDGYFDNSSKNGLKFDSFRYGGCKTPLGSRTEEGDIEFELIHTPNEMAKFQELGNEELEKQHIPIGLFSAEYIMSDENLFIDYQKKVKIALETGEKKPHLERGVTVLKEDLDEFQIDLISQHEEGKIYDVKREIYRLSDRVIAALCLSLGIYEPNGWKKIEALASLVGEENTFHLNVIFSLASEVRLRSYLEMDEQHEKWLANHIGSLFKKNNPFDVFFRYYYRALTLQKNIEQFLTALDKKWLGNIYFDDNLYQQGIIHKKLMCYEKGLKCCLGYIEKNSTHSKALHLAGFLFNTLAEATKAVGYYEQALAIVKEVYGEKHPDVALSLNNLGAAWDTLGDAKKAVGYYEQALAIAKEVYGDKHPHVGATLNNLGSAWETLGDAKKAVGYYEQALAIVKEVYGEKHPDVALSLNNLGGAWYKLGDAKKAVGYYEQALVMDKEVYGDKHPSVALSLNNLGGAWYKLGDAKKALGYYEQALVMDKEVYGDKHPTVATRLNNLGLAWKTLGDVKKAVGYYEQALVIDKEVYGDKHPTVATRLNNLGLAWKTLGDAKKAVGYYEQALAIDKEVYGDKHPTVATRFNNLGLAWETLGDAKKAVGYYEQALAIDKEVYGDKHPDVATRLNNLGAAWYTLGDAKKAVGYYEQALAIDKEVYGDKHPDVATRLNNLGLAWYTLGDAKKAVGYYEQALAIDKEVYGDKHPDVATRLNNLGAAWYTLGDAKKAVGYYEQALAIAKEVYGDKHPHVGATLNNLGSAWKTLGDAKKAVGYYEQALAMAKEVYGDKHPSVALSLNNLAGAWYGYKQPEKAFPYVLRSYIIQLVYLGESHPSTRTIKTNLSLMGSDFASQLILKGDKKTAQQYKRFEGIQYKNFNQYYEHAHSNPNKTAILLPIAYAQLLIELAPWESEGYYELAKSLLIAAIDAQTSKKGQWTYRIVQKAFYNMKKAMELKPCSLYQATYAYLLLNQGQYDDAIQQARQVLTSISQASMTNELIHFHTIDDGKMLPSFLQSYLSIVKTADYSAKIWALFVLIIGYQTRKDTKSIKLYTKFLVQEIEKYANLEMQVLLAYIYRITGEKKLAEDLFETVSKKYQALKNEAAYEFLLPFTKQKIDVEKVGKLFSTLSISSFQRSTFFSKNTEKTFKDLSSTFIEKAASEWYTQDDINKLLIYYQNLTENESTDILTCLLGTDITKNDNMLRDNLLDYQTDRMENIVNNKPVKKNAIISVNLGNAHWVLLYIAYPTDNAKLPTIQYIDPLGGGINSEVKEVLHNELLYPNADIQVSQYVLQKDSYNCGALVVELARRLIADEKLIEKLEIDIESSREEHKKILEEKELGNFILKKI